MLEILNMSKHYGYKGDRSKKYFVVHHNLNARSIDQEFSQAYKDGFRAVSRQFAAHFQEQGYARTQAQFYLNNKPGARRLTWWTLDEPHCRQEWLAIAWWARLYHDGAGQVPGVDFAFRGDISRPEWQFDTCDGLMDVIYVNSGMFGKVRTVRNLAQRAKIQVYVYGSCNAVERQPLESTAWCFKAYAAGADGVLPWSSVKGGGALTKPETNGLLVDGSRFGIPCVASMRVLALRSGAQVVEILRKVAARRKLTRDQAGLLIAQKIPLGGNYRQRFGDEASAVTFGRLSGDNLAHLKEGLLLMLK